MPSKRSTSGGKSKNASAARGGPVPPYGVPINQAIAGGNLREMKAMAVRTRKYIADLGRALKALDGAIEKRKG